MKTIKIFTLLCGLLLLLSSCGNPSTPVATQAQAPVATQAQAPVVTEEAKPVEITMYVPAAPGHKDIPRMIVDAYTAIHPNVKVEIIESSSADTIAKEVAAYKTTPNNPYVDMAFFNEKAHMTGLMNNMWDTISIENVPNLNNVLPEFRVPEDRGVGFATGFFSIIYNTDFIKEPPDSYAAFWDPQYKGHVAFWQDQLWEVILAARLNGGSETNMDPGFKLWAANADQLQSLYTSNETIKNLMVSGDVWLTFFDAQQVMVWNSTAKTPVGISIPKEGAVAWPLFIDISKGLTPEQKKVCEDLTNMALSLEYESKFADMTDYVPTIKGYQPSSTLASLPTFNPDVLKNAIQFDWSTYIQQIGNWDERYASEVQSKMTP